ncbi:hypothetical protein EYF80_014232 [Liparis tanakae]|uniref:Uncharacterized protein n=1 Tax=Liparis tanakae TaxID=230148 RepID=A0A4Z2IC01_9TELE|nr:hypothetical protein EYF80_014232 [Liparis tanakae]
MVNLVGNAKVSPLRPWCVLARGVATVFSAPARIIMKNERSSSAFKASLFSAKKVKRTESVSTTSGPLVVWINSLAISSSLSASASTWEPRPCSSSVQQFSAWLAW